MKKIFIFQTAVLVFFSVSSPAESENPPPSAVCNSKLRDLNAQYERECDGRNPSPAKCIQLKQNRDDKQRDCQNKTALEEGDRKIKDAKAAVDKQNNKTDTLSKISKLVGAGLVAAGTAPCPKGCRWDLIAMGLAGIAQGMLLGDNSSKLSDTSAGLSDPVNTCVGGNCPPPGPGAGDPSAPNLGPGSGLFGPNATLPGLTDCEPSCPCPPGADKLQNCKITKDKNGMPKLTHGPDKDKDGFGDEEATAADAAKVNQNDPKIKAAVAAAKAPYAGLLAELENDDEEGPADEELLSATDGGPGEEGFLSGGGARSGKSAATPAGRSPRRKAGADDDMKAVQGLMAQFMQKKKKKKSAGLKAETKLLGKSQIGVARDNIFLMVHRRYQERRAENEFIETDSLGAASSAAHNLFK